MKLNLRAMIVFVACGLAACTTQEARPDGGGAGTSGNAGNSGGAGTTGTGGGGGLATNDGVLCLPPDQAITNFMPDPDGGSTTEPRFGVFGTSWSGGGSTYGQLTQSVTGNDWHIMGMITDYSGFNLYSDNVNSAMCNRIDASAYAGVTFTIWGSLGGTNTLTMGMGTLSNTPPGSWLKSVGDTAATGNEPGRCFPAAGGTQYYHPGCGDAVNTFSVTGTQASPQTISILWNGFTGGTPQANVVPTDIVSIYWYVSWGGAASTSYPVDIHIDNLAFIPK